MMLALRHALFLSLALLLVGTANADWSGYRGDNGRRGYTEADLAPTLRLAWTNELAPPPAPAWPAPARGSLWQNLTHIEPRVTDDAAYHPVIADGKVLFGSSADDHLYCLDAVTGQKQWAYVADAPIRYAPAVADGKVYFGSDDGLVRCLALDGGELIWTARIGPDGGLIPGNGRMISPWPVRTGLIVDAGTVYACAGLFPTQGTYAAALDAADGSEQWRTRLGDLSPQGYLLASADKLYVPTGRSNPFEIDRATGKVGRTFGSPGGTFAILADDALITGPGNDNTLRATSPQSAQQLVQFQGKHMVVGPTVSYFLTGQKLFALDRSRYAALTVEAAALRSELKGLDGGGEQVERARQIQTRLGEIDAQAAACMPWEIATTDQGALAATGELVVVGGPGRVTAYNTETGRKAWDTRIEGAARSLAIADGLLVVTTDTGQVLGYRVPGDTPRPVRTARVSPEIEPLAASDRTRIRDAVASLPNPRGWALLLGSPSPAAVAELLKASEMQALIVTRDAEAAASLRDTLASMGLYGRRAAVMHREDGQVPVTDYAINLALVFDADAAAWDPDEVRRVLAPGRGVAWTSADASFTRPPLDHIGEWTHQYANPGNTSNSDEMNLAGGVALQWFGGPGPNRMIDRHLRGPPPLAFDGKLIMVGENKLIGVDAYNGTELWELDLPDSQRYAMPYDAGYIAAGGGKLYAAVDHELYIIDPETGKRTGKANLPRSIDPRENHWGYVGVVGEQLIGSVIRPTAPITEPQRSVSDLSYRSAYPLATSRGLFSYPQDNPRRADWTYADGLIVNGTITIAHERIYFVESRNEAGRADTTGRVAVADLVASDAYVVALDLKTGDKVWEQPVNLPSARNILYLVGSDDGKLVLTTSIDAEADTAHYYLRVMDAGTGDAIWATDHRHVKGGLYHGEQVHHPVILGNRLVAEPFMYDLTTGDLLNPDGDPAPGSSNDQPWAIRRPGHSCGTLSGAGDYLFFRASNPTMLDLTSTVHGQDRFTRLAPSRTGCWINVLPAQGLVLIPEASASCVCSYSLQTSMAFRPVPRPAADDE